MGYTPGYSKRLIGVWLGYRASNPLGLPMNSDAAGTRVGGKTATALADPHRRK